MKRLINKEVVVTRTPDVKKWLLAKVRLSLKGAALSEKLDRFVSGELDEYRFNLEVNLNDEVRKHLESAAGRDQIRDEKLE